MICPSTRLWRDTFEEFQLRTGFPNFFVFEALRRGKNGRAEDQIWKRGQKKLEKEKESEKGESAVTKRTETERKKSADPVSKCTWRGTWPPKPPTRPKSATPPPRSPASPPDSRIDPALVWEPGRNPDVILRIQDNANCSSFLVHRWGGGHSGHSTDVRRGIGRKGGEDFVVTLWRRDWGLSLHPWPSRQRAKAHFTSLSSLQSFS